MLPASLQRAWRKGRFRGLRSGRTSATCRQLQPISSSEDSLAKTSASLARVLGLPAAAADSGTTCSPPLCVWEPASSSLRTSQLSLFAGSTKYSDRLPRRGSMRSGCIYARATSAPATNGTGSSYWPTARAISGGAESAERKQELGRKDAGGGDLQSAAQQWPTPNSQSPNALRGGGDPTRCSNPERQTNLQDRVAAWPTPTPRDHKDGACADQEVPTNALLGRTAARFGLHPPRTPDGETSSDGGPTSPRRSTQEGLWTTPASDDVINRTQRYAQGGTALSTQAVQLWGTPQAQHDAGSRNTEGSKANPGISLADQVFTGSSRSGRKGNTKRLNPLFVEWLMGFPIGWTDCEL